MHVIDTNAKRSAAEMQLTVYLNHIRFDDMPDKYLPIQRNSFAVATDCHMIKAAPSAIRISTIILA